MNIVETETTHTVKLTDYELFMIRNALNHMIDNYYTVVGKGERYTIASHQAFVQLLKDIDE